MMSIPCNDSHNPTNQAQIALASVYCGNNPPASNGNDDRRRRDPASNGNYISPRGSQSNDPQRKSSPTHPRGSQSNDPQGKSFSNPTTSQSRESQPSDTQDKSIIVYGKRSSDGFLKKTQRKRLKTDNQSSFKEFYKLEEDSKKTIIVLSLNTSDSLTYNLSLHMHEYILNHVKKKDLIMWHNLNTWSLPIENKLRIYQIIVVGHGNHFELQYLSKLISYFNFYNPKMILFANCFSSTPKSLQNYEFGICGYVSEKLQETICIGFNKEISTSFEKITEKENILQYYYDSKSRDSFLFYSYAFKTFIPNNCDIFINGEKFINQSFPTELISQYWSKMFPSDVSLFST
jgi:hypothetical protein